jgi:1-acyl-sn-glycerol-3-phosphate acyltransferase
MVFKAYCDMPIVGHGLHAWGVVPVDAKMGARTLIAAVETATAKPAVERAVAPPAQRAPVNRPATKKADAAASMPDDDIPF